MLKHRPLRAGLLAAGLGLLAPLSSEAIGQSRVGTTGAVNPQSQFDRATGIRTIVIGDDVLFQDRIITGEIGLVQVMFVDGSTFTVGPTARVVIDEFVFDPATSTGSLVAEVTSGALRFVGGKLSKRNNTVRFRTPGGTLGVRGGIADLDLDPRCTEDGRCPTATASFVFGRELTLELNNGTRRRIHQPGYSFAFFGDPANPTVEIVRTSELDQSGLQARLTGRPGATGGSTAIPTSQNVVQSGIPQQNSSRAPIVVLPRPKPIVVTSRYSPDGAAPGISEVTKILDATILETAQSDFINTVVQDDTEGDGPNIAEDGITAFATPPVFDPDDFPIVENPGNVGIVQQVDLTQFGAEFVRNEEGELIAIRVGEDELPFPSVLGETTIEPFRSRTLDVDVDLRGTVFRGEDDFAFYYAQEDLAGDAGADEVIYLLTGKPTEVRKIFPAEGRNETLVRSYSFEDDYQKRNRDIASEMRLLNPIIAREFGDVLEGASETPFFVVQPPDGAVPKTLYAGLVIDGSGNEQVSAINLDIGFVNANGNDSGLEIVGRRRGSYRVSATNSAAAMEGSTGTFSAFDDGDFASLYGENGNNFVYTTGVVRGPASEAQDLYFDNQRTDGVLEEGEVLSSSTMVAQLNGVRRGRAFDRTSRIVKGFAAGIVEPSAFGTRVFRSTEVGDLSLETNATNGTVGGLITVRDVLEADPVIRSMTLAFGSDGLGGDVSDTRSTFVDDSTFGAVASGTPGEPGSPQTTITTNSGRVIDHDNSSPATYLVSSDAVPQSQLFEAAGVTECTCAFLDWGWWGTATDFEDGSLDQNVRNNVHLGTWVAGDVTREQDMPTVGSGSYEGHAAGTVSAGNPDGTRSRYVAVGDLRVDYNFGARSGTLEITNFDGRDFSGTIAGSRAADGVSNQFNGLLAGSDVKGSTNGAFVNNGNRMAGGVLGGFDVRGRSYRASGSYVGARIPSAAMTGPN